ncbi:MAG: hypothetical protein ACRDS0_02645 [Pseudonocardiaceae bacterium]
MYSRQQAIETTLAPPVGPSALSRRQRRIDRLIAESGTTPGKLRVARMILVIGILLAGSVAGLAAYSRADTTREIAEHLAPLNANATTLYRSLADADATVALAFLSGGAEPPELRAQYIQDRDLAATSLREAAAQTSQERETGDPIADISRELPIYTGYVERVRANNRQGNTAAGRAYLGLASELMKNSILPQAADLQRRQATRLETAYQRAGSLPVVALTAGAASLGGLIWAQVFVYRRTHRVVNFGLVAASGAVVVGLLWWTTAGVASATTLGSAHRHSQAVSDLLGPAQIAALRARAIETNRLVSSTGTATEEDFHKQMQLVQARLGDAQRFDPDQVDLADGEAAARNYSSAHEEVQKEVKDGADTTAAAGAAAARFKELDQTVSNAIARERAAFTGDIQHAQGWWLTWLSISTGVLALAAAVGVALGVRQRLEEYR